MFRYEIQTIKNNYVNRQVFNNNHEQLQPSANDISGAPMTIQRNISQQRSDSEIKDKRYGSSLSNEEPEIHKPKSPNSRVDI